MKFYGSLRSTSSPRNAAGCCEASWGRRGILFALASLLLLATPKSSEAQTLVSSLLSNTNGVVNGVCNVPPPDNLFYPATDSQIWLTLNINGVQVGDTLAINYYRPGGVRYTTVNHTYTIAGQRCDSFSINLAGTQVANYPGYWTILAYYNGSSTPLVSLNFGVAPVLLNDVITTVNPSGVGNTVSCSGVVPSSVNTFATTAPQVWVYSDFNGASAGDTVAVNWYRPDGVLYQTSGNKTVFSPGANGYQCFAFFITLAGAAAANHPGTWTILAYYNGSQTPGPKSKKFRGA